MISAGFKQIAIPTIQVMLFALGLVWVLGWGVHDALTNSIVWHLFLDAMSKRGSK
jgi:hypothetical protein